MTVKPVSLTSALIIFLVWFTTVGCNGSSEMLGELEQLKTESKRMQAQLHENQKKLSVVERVLDWRSQPLPVSLADLSFEIHEEMFVPYIHGQATIHVDTPSMPSRFYVDTHYQISFTDKKFELNGNSISMIESGKGVLSFKQRLPEHNLPIEKANIKFTPHAWYEGFPTKLSAVIIAEQGDSNL